MSDLEAINIFRGLVRRHDLKESGFKYLNKEDIEKLSQGNVQFSQLSCPRDKAIIDILVTLSDYNVSEEDINKFFEYTHLKQVKISGFLDRILIGAGFGLLLRERCKLTGDEFRMRFLLKKV